MVRLPVYSRVEHLVTQSSFNLRRPRRSDRCWFQSQRRPRSQASEPLKNHSRKPVRRRDAISSAGVCAASYHVLSQQATTFYELYAGPTGRHNDTRGHGHTNVVADEDFAYIGGIKSRTKSKSPSKEKSSSFPKNTDGHKASTACSLTNKPASHTIRRLKATTVLFSRHSDLEKSDRIIRPSHLGDVFSA